MRCRAPAGCRSFRFGWAGKDGFDEGRVIGLGTQGKYLAVNLAHSAHDLMAYDVRQPPLDGVAEAGARIAGSNREVGAHGEVIEICVLDDAQLEDVVLGADGVLAGAAPGTIVAVHSTVEPGTIDRLAEAARSGTSS